MLLLHLRVARLGLSVPLCPQLRSLVLPLLFSLCEVECLAKKVIQRRNFQQVGY